MKRLYKIIIFSLIIYISIVCQIKSSIAATTSGECGDNLKWTYDDQCGQLIISGQGAMEDYTSSANTPWKKYRKDIKNITLGDGVTHIGNNAFGWCESLTDIEFSDTIISLGEGCFEYCKSLSDIRLPSNVIEIDKYAFDLGNTILNSISIPESIKKIGYCAFYCDDINSINYNGTIDEWASIEFDGYQANPVYYSNNLYINNNLVTDVKLKIVDYNQYAFGNMKTLQKFQFAIGTKKIYKETFKNCINIESIIIPNSITDIGESSFSGCESLKYIEIPSNINEIKDYTFYNCRKLEEIIVPSSVTKIGRYAFYNCDSLRDVIFEKGELSNIAEYAFARCGIENIQIPDTVTFIGEDAFRENKNLKKIVLSKGMDTIPRYVFAESGLEYFIVPTSIKTIDDYAFSMCGNLKYVAIPPEVEKIGDESFDSCGKYIQISDDVKQYVNGSFIIKGENGSYAEEYAISKSPQYGFEIHAYLIDEIVAPSCKEEGYTRYRCVLCNEQKNADYTDRTNKHEVVIDEAIAPTCIKPGLTEGSHCSVCNEVLQVQEEIPALGHTWNAGEVTTVPTCTEAGVNTFTCETCGETRTEEIKATGHTVVDDEAVAPTCTKTGLTTGRHCSVCNEVLTAQEEVPALGHTWNAGEVTTAPTCTESGIKTFTCEICGETRTEEVRKTGHTVVVDNAVGPTCTKPGLTAGSHCSVCNEVLQAQEEVPALGHTWNTGTITKQPTYTAKGIRTYTCTVCKETKKEDIPALKRTDITKTASKVKITGIENKIYNGKAQTQTALVITANGKKLKNGTDYTVKYKDNKNIGTATFTITGKNAYMGTIKKTFAIKTAVGKVYSGTYKYKITSAKTNGTGTVSIIGSAYAKTSKKFTTLKVADTVTIGGVKFKITRIETKAFMGYQYLKNVAIGSNVTSIGNYAFYKCPRLETVTVGKNVKTIGTKVFYGCKNFRAMKILSSKLTKVGTSTFAGIKANATFALPKKYYNSYSKVIKKSGAPKKAVYKKF